MTFNEAITSLKAMGTAQNRERNAQLGAGPDQFGVSTANLEKLRRSIRRDPLLSEQLWACGNFDACTLALLICDPSTTSLQEAETWVDSTRCPYHIPLLADGLLANTSFGPDLARRWRESDRPFREEAAWWVVAAVAAKSPHLRDAYFEELLVAVEGRITRAPTRVAVAMHDALVAIGCRHQRLRKMAEETARRLGTTIEGRDAEAEIRKKWARKSAHLKKSR
jgi:3-methyladenine DNA glycosylase AlkD